MNVRSFSMWPIAASLLFGVACETAESAQTVYRCGNTYNYVGCSNAKAVSATSPVSASDRKEAERVASRQRRLGREMEGDRRREEASIKPAKAGSFKVPPAHAAASAPRKVMHKHRRVQPDVETAKTEPTDVFAAKVPAAPKPK